MPTRDDIYLEFGRLAELCQLFETELGTALLAHDAIETKAYVRQNPDAVRRLIDEIGRKTLGRTLKMICSQFEVKSDLSHIYNRALNARNILMHGFFLYHGSAIESVTGRKKIIKHMKELRYPLEIAYQSASMFSQILMDALLLLKKVHTK